MRDANSARRPPRRTPQDDNLSKSFQLAPKSWGARVLLLLVRFYMAFLSPFFGGACKFYPSCSSYAAEAIARHGARRGAVLTVKRLLRCHPFTRGGVDLVPEIEREAFRDLPATPVVSKERAL